MPPPAPPPPPQPVSSKRGSPAGSTAGERATAAAAELRAQALAAIEERSKGVFTHLRSSFKGCACLTVGYFLWLIKNRGFKNFTIHHYIHYHEGTYMSNRMREMADKRWRIKKKIKAALARKGAAVSDVRKVVTALKSLSELFKLLPNSFYGYQMLNANRFDKYSVVTESYLKKRGLPENWVDLKYLGFAKTKKEGEIQMTYLSSKRSSSGFVSNCVHIAATVLGNSR